MSLPVSLQLDDSTRVEVYLHSFFLGDRERQCWTFLTRGFEALGQREMSLSLLVDDGADPEDYPKTPVRLFQLLSERFDGSRPVDFGDASRLGQRGILGFTAAFYVPAIQFEGLPNLGDYLSLVLVHDQEYDYAQQYGLTRFLSRLGRYCSSFPYPTWNTGARPSLFTEGSKELSILAKAHHIMAEHSYVQQQDSTIKMLLHEKDIPAIFPALANLADDQVAVISTAFAPGCDASLYWQEGQTAAGAFAAPDTAAEILGGSFVALSKGESCEFAIEEDGFAICLTASRWQALHTAIEARQSLELPLGDRERLALSVIDEAPIGEIRHYEPVAVWKRLEHEAGGNQPDPKVTLHDYEDASEDQNLAARVSQGALLDYLALLQELLSRALAEETSSVRFTLELSINKEGCRAAVTCDEPLNPDFIDFIAGAVTQVEPCKVVSEISVRVPVTVNSQEVH